MHTFFKAVLFSLTFVAVDWLSFIYPMGHLNITPWNPPAALEVLFLYWAGRRWWIWVYLTLCLSDLLVREATLLSSSVLVGNAVLVTCYAAMASAFRHLLSTRSIMGDRNELLKLGLTIVLGSALTAVGYVGLQSLMGAVPRESTWEGMHRFFIGDLLGFFIVLPLVFVMTDKRRHRQYAHMFKRVQFWGLTGALVVCLWAVFSMPLTDQMRYFFSLFIVLGLLSATYSLPGATFASALIQLPLVFSSSKTGMTPEVLMDMQIVMLSLSLTGLIIGMVVEERVMAEQRLRDSLQLIAAGELAGSLAHELHQPLSAISAYSESAMIMLDQAEHDKSLLPTVKSTLAKVVSETLRASDIVGGLRSYFIGGSSNPKLTGIASIVDDCVVRAQTIFRHTGVQIERSIPAPDLHVFVDGVQIKTALGNLIKNAVEASSPGMTVKVLVFASGPQHLTIRVIDQGDGLKDEVAEQVFKPFYSLKRDGLGLGLSVSRSLIEVNAGVLRYLHQPVKCFEIVLPIERGEA
jgi:signal transduction histidine kinase